MKRFRTLKLLSAFVGMLSTHVHAADTLPIGSPYELADENFENEALQELVRSSTVISQDAQLSKVLSGTLLVPSAEGKARCRISKSMLNFLLTMSRNSTPLQGLLVYAGGGQHARLYRDPDTNSIACVNNAMDISSVNGRQILYVDPDATRDAIVGLLGALPPGKFEIGLPRQPYPNGERDANNVNLAGRDIIKYFVQKKWTWLYKEDPNQPLMVAGNLNPERFQLNDPNVDSYRHFYAWAYNTNPPVRDDLSKTTSRLWRYLGGSDPSPEQTAMRSSMVQGFDSGRISELTRSMIRNRTYASDIADAMEDARARGVTIIGTYGDALDHIHIEDLDVREPNPPSTIDTSTLSLEYDTNYYGRDYTSKKLPRPDWKICADTCERDTRCEAYTFVPVGLQDPSSAICWLKSGVSEPSPLRDGVSGVRKKLPGLGLTIMHNRDLMGSDYSRFPVVDYKECARVCDRDDSCRAFTFVQAGVQEASAICYLKNNVPTLSVNADTISGVKTFKALRNIFQLNPNILKP